MTDTNEKQYELTSGFSTTRTMMWALFTLGFLTASLALTGDTQAAAELASTGTHVAALMMVIEFASWAITQIGYRWGSYPRAEGEVE